MSTFDGKRTYQQKRSGIRGGPCWIINCLIMAVRSYSPKATYNTASIPHLPPTISPLGPHRHSPLPGPTGLFLPIRAPLGLIPNPPVPTPSSWLTWSLPQHWNKLLHHAVTQLNPRSSRHVPSSHLVAGRMVALSGIMTLPQSELFCFPHDLHSAVESIEDYKDHKDITTSKSKHTYTPSSVAYTAGMSALFLSEIYTISQDPDNKLDKSCENPLYIKWKQQQFIWNYFYCFPNPQFIAFLTN